MCFKFVLRVLYGVCVNVCDVVCVVCWLFLTSEWCLWCCDVV